jgi:glycosyltransferase involved in cell wall biosynthesis
LDVVEPAAPGGLRLLFVKESLAWPRSSGHDVHCFHMMRALAGLGHEVSLATLARPADEAVAGLPLRGRFELGGDAPPDGRPAEPLPLSRMQERFRSYWGIDTDRVRRVADAARACQADAVVVVGLNVLPYLGGVWGALRVWYAADEWAWHHLSQVRLTRPGTWGNARQAVVKGLYERAYAPILDRVWVVTGADRRAMRLVAGVSNVDVLPNGVDGEHYRPLGRPQEERSCVFWGRLDFGPNVQALEWFCRGVWPSVRREAPDARFIVYGFNPSGAVRSLVGRDGIDLVPDLPDLRPEVSRHSVVVLPFVSGGGIKNKLLEAAALGKAIVCTSKARRGLRLEDPAPLLTPRGRRRWARDILALWADPGRRDRLGEAAREWVLKNHSWAASARDAAAGLLQSRRGECR